MSLLLYNVRSTIISHHAMTPEREHAKETECRYSCSEKRQDKTDSFQHPPSVIELLVTAYTSFFQF